MSSTLQYQTQSPLPVSIGSLTGITSDDVEQGTILWLAPKHEVLKCCPTLNQEDVGLVVNLRSGLGPNDGFYNHPILVISRPASDPNTIRFLHMTTFSKQSLKKRFKPPHLHPERRKWLAVSPSSDHPLFLDGDPMYKALTLEGGLSMEKKGYVGVAEIYSMDWRKAQPFWRAGIPQRARLDAQSLRTLLQATKVIGGYRPGIQYDPTTMSPGAMIPTVSALPPSPARPITSAGERPPHFAFSTPIDCVRQATRTTRTIPTHPVTQPGNRPLQSYETEPLLPKHPDEPADSPRGPGQGLLLWIWTYLTGSIRRWICRILRYNLV